MQPDPKLVAREKKIFDVSAKAKDRIKLLTTLEEDGFRAHDVYARKAADVILLCEQHVAALANAKFQKGKLCVGQEAVKPFVDILRRVVLTNAEKISAEGWQLEFFSDVAERALHVDAPHPVRRSGLALLLGIVDAARGHPNQPALLRLVYRSMDWGALCSCSDSALEAPSHVQPNDRQYDFMQRRTPPREDDAGREALELLRDVLEHIGTRTGGELEVWWAWFRAAVVPVLYPNWVPSGRARHAALVRDCLALDDLAVQPLDGGRPRGRSQRLTDAASKVVGLPHQVHRLVAVLLLSLLGGGASSQALLQRRADPPLADLEFVVEVLGASFLILSPEDAHLSYRIARILCDWVAKPAGAMQDALSDAPEYIAATIACSLTKLFIMRPEDVLPTPSLVQMKSAMFELACDFFVTVQARRSVLFSAESANPRLHVGLLKLWLEDVVTPVSKAADKDVAIYDGSRELISWAFYVQWLHAEPRVTECDVIGIGLNALMQRTKTALAPGSKTAVHTIPTTTCPVFFSSNPLVLHWRSLVLNILRNVIGAVCEFGGVPVPAAYPSFCVDVCGAAPSGLGLVRGSVFASAVPGAGRARTTPPPSPAGPPTARKKPLMGLTQKDLETLEWHRGRSSPYPPGDDILPTLLAPRDLPQLTALWVALFRVVATPHDPHAAPAAQPPPVHLTVLHTISDVVSDLLYSTHAYRFFDPSGGKRKGDIAKRVELLFHLQMPSIPSLPQAAIPADTLAELVLDVLLAALGPAHPREFHTAGGAHMALATLCDLLSLGFNLKDAYRTKACAAIVRALGEKRTTGLTFVPLYRLFPVGLFPAGISTSHVLFNSPACAKELLAPLALSATFYIGTPPQTHLAAQYPGLSLQQALPFGGVSSGETTIRCAAVGVLNWCVPVVLDHCLRGEVKDVFYPEGYSLPSPHPTKYQELLTCMADALRRVIRGDQPAEARVLGLHGLGALLLQCLAGGGPAWSIGLRSTGAKSTGSSTYQDLATTVLHDVAVCLLDADSSVAQAAVSVCHSMVTVLTAPTKVPGLMDALTNAVGTALLAALAEYHKHKRPRIVVQLIDALHALLLAGVPRDARVLAICALSYASYGRVFGTWYVPRVAVLRKQVGYCAFPVERSAGAAVPQDYTAVGTVAEDSDEGPWWGAMVGTGLSDDELDDDAWLEPKTSSPVSAVPTSPMDVRHAAAAALDHYLVHFEHFPDSAPDRSSAFPAPDRAGDADFTTLLCNGGKAVVSLTEEDTAVLLTSRTQTGRYSWQLKRVVTLNDSLFDPRECVGQYGQSRSMSGAVVGRVRTHALHGATRGGGHHDFVRSESVEDGTPAAADGGDLLAQVCEKCTPEYITTFTADRMQPDSSWMEKFKKGVAGVPDVHRTEQRPTGDVGSTVPAPAGPAQPNAGLEGLEAALPRHNTRNFLATGPLLDYHVSASPYHIIPGASAARMPAKPVPKSLCALDALTERDTFTCTVLYATHDQTTEMAVLDNAAAKCSAQYHFFLKGLGWLAGKDHRGFRGRAFTTDTAGTDMSGTFSLLLPEKQGQSQVTSELRYYATSQAETVFHVCTSVSGDDAAEVQAFKQAMIADDAVQVVWNEADTPYPVAAVARDAVVLWIVLTPLSEGMVGVSLSHRGVPVSGPLVDGMVVPLHLLGPLVRAHATRSLAMRAPRAVLVRRAAIKEAEAVFQDRPPTLAAIGVPAHRSVGTC
eukprot:TRINITY_DN19091_c0_g1_i1.p1 TRINITY_DN19091_c0_g1~~TRINITY_DN19091_c0_g1_i1.p1  ORF type:complete len:1706 (+),score=573.43 TRINITY_DN19091_c0_g1_i1:146-5263(+)